jgi:uncharacterized protein (DUF2236 family)
MHDANALTRGRCRYVMAMDVGARHIMLQDKISEGSNGAPRRVTPMPKVDFLAPRGAPALYAADSLTWRIYKNPVALFVGGITAVLLELAEPRVRSGVWGHSIFPTDPLLRMQRTGMMAFVTVYAPAETARRLIAAVGRMHDRVAGVAPDGTPYRAKDPELLDWVQATASFGFLEAYARYVRPLTDAQRDRYYAEAQASASLYGAAGAPASLAAQRAQFDAMRTQLESHPIVGEFLGLVEAARALPGPLWLLQPMLIRAAVDLLPGDVRATLQLGSRWDLAPWQARMIHRAGRLTDRIAVPESPPVQACQRMGLPRDWLQRGW